MRTTRRKFLATASGGAAALLVGCNKSRVRFPGRIVGAAAAVGHRLRNGNFSQPSETLQTDIVIVGSGIAGLAAARRLDQRGAKDFLLLELEGAPGGNAASGQKRDFGLSMGSALCAFA